MLTESGTPVSQAHISLNAGTYDFEGSSAYIGDTVGRTNADGYFKLTKIPVSAIRPGFRDPESFE